MIADETEALFRVKPLAVEGDDARRLLAAVLQSVQPERGNRRGLGVAEDAKHSAFFAQPVIIGIEYRRRGRDGL